MDEQRVREILSGRDRRAAARCLRAGLWAASKPYAAAMRLRRWAYRRGILRSRAAGAPVICVGNLTTGGTGKTPMVAWVVRRLVEAGRTPAILTRGYKSRPGGQGGEGDSDEVRLLRELTGAAIAADPDRVAGAAAAVAGGADVLVMDDGFQHRRLRRDLDIVLIDAGEPFGFGHCLPRGLLREPPSALADADAVVITHGDEVPLDRLMRLGERVRRLAPRASHHAAVHRPTGLIDDAGAARPLGDLLGRKVCAFCGLGSPEHFFTTLAGLGARLAARRALDDHAVYTPALLAELAAEAKRAEAGILVTTQKDHVKLAGMDCPAPLWQLAVEMEITGGRDELVERILGAAGAAPRSNDPRTQAGPQPDKPVG
jgi:tetraacyldisaccharide 4'-kinase